MVQKIALAAILGASLLAGSACTPKRYVDHPKYVDETRVVDFESMTLTMHSYIAENYPRLVGELKKEYDFEFLQKVPMPDVGYFVFGNAGQEGAYAFYNPDEKKIFISVFHNIYLSPDYGFKVGRKDEGTEFLDEALKHEFVHYYTHLLSEASGAGRFPIDRADVTSDREALTYLDILKCEGISETLVPSRRRKHDFSDDKWPLIINNRPLNSSFDFSQVYSAAQHFVKPIIDSRGEAGIVAIIMEKTSPNDLQDIPALRKRILERLEKNYK